MANQPVIFSIVVFALCTGVFVFFLIPYVIIPTFKDLKDEKVTWGGFGVSKQRVFYKKDEPTKFWYWLLVKCIFIVLAAFYFLQSIFYIVKLFHDARI